MTRRIYAAYRLALRAAVVLPLAAVALVSGFAYRVWQWRKGNHD